MEAWWLANSKRVSAAMDLVPMAVLVSIALFMTWTGYTVGSIPLILMGLIGAISLLLIIGGELRSIFRKEYKI
jgi:hypothetical protein